MISGNWAADTRGGDADRMYAMQ